MPKPLSLSNGIEDFATQQAVRQLEKSAGDTSTSLDSIFAGLPVKAKQGASGATSGVFTDKDFTDPVDGLLGVDTTNSRLYVRVGGVWKSVVLS